MSQRVDRLETLNQRLNHELAVLRRHRFARRSEQLNADQLNLLDEMIEADIAAIEAELEAVRPKSAKRELRQQPKRAPLPAELPRTLILHEPDSTQCACGCQLKRIGEDVSEKLELRAINSHSHLKSVAISQRVVLFFWLGGFDFEV